MKCKTQILRYYGDLPTSYGVSTSATCASQAHLLLENVLRLLRGDPDLMQAAQTGAANLARYADEDTAAFQQYMARRNDAAALHAIVEIPLKIAQAAVDGIALCEQADRFVNAFVASDLGAAKELLRGAVRATLLSIDFNISLLTKDDPLYRDAITRRNTIAKIVLIPNAP